MAKYILYDTDGKCYIAMTKCCHYGKCKKLDRSYCGAAPIRCRLDTPENRAFAELLGYKELIR